MAEGNLVQVSIVTACRNEIDHIGSLLESILSQDIPGGAWEAMVADGMSTDGTREILQQYSTRYPCLRVIDNPGLIVSTGLNAAIRQARGDIIIRMDGHTRYAPDYCKNSVEALFNNAADNVGGPARTVANGVLAGAVAAAFHSRFSTGGAKFHAVDYEGWVDTVPYGCWRKAVLERIGLFDETLVRNQDDELNLRLVRAGGRIWQSPSIVSWYRPRSDLSKLFHQYFQYGFWKVAVIRKHKLPASWRHIIPVVWVSVNLLLVLVMTMATVLRSPGWLRDAAVLWLVVVGLYLSVSMSVAVCTARHHGWALLPYLPVVFAIYHLSYGLGFAAGLVRLMNHPGGGFSPPSTSNFAKLSR